MPVQTGNERWMMPGMSLRDYFAGLVAQGMMGGHWPSGQDMPEMARRAWQMADEMLKARQS
jgi:hypothetical protein